MSFQTHKLSDFIKNILICDPKRNEGLMGLEWHEGVNFCLNYPFKS